MTGRLRVRVYNVLFGDAVLVSVPDRDDSGAAVTRHILFDVGNVLSGAAGANSVYAPIFQNVLAELGGRPLDLYVMTHEHLDHVEGPRFAAGLGLGVQAEHVWMTASAEGDAYYARHPEAQKKKLALFTALETLRALVAADGSARFNNMLVNNDPTAKSGRGGTAAAVDHIRTDMVTATGRLHYIHQGSDVSAAHPFRDFRIEVLAPAEDTSAYYGRPRPFRFGEADTAPTAVNSETLRPPAGVDAGAFYDLVRARAEGYPETLLAIDKAANNTSLVLKLTWNGKTLLFCGDAEQASWNRMLSEGALGPIDFLKIGHHGSHNGTPLDNIDVMFPPGRDKTNLHVAVSTCCGAYNGVPHDITVNALRDRAQIHDTRTVAAGGFLDIFL